MAHKLVHFFIGDQCVYTKNDVDLVISDMKSEADREIRKQKRKRCLAMAQKYLWKRNYWRDSTPAYERQFVWENRAYKHYKRWRELAERFEEVE